MQPATQPHVTATALIARLADIYGCTPEAARFALRDSPRFLPVRQALLEASREPLPRNLPALLWMAQPAQYEQVGVRSTDPRYSAVMLARCGSACQRERCAACTEAAQLLCAAMMSLCNEVEVDLPVLHGMLA